MVLNAIAPPEQETSSTEVHTTGHTGNTPGGRQPRQKHQSSGVWLNRLGTCMLWLSVKLTSP
eukprot:28275-Amphidinium_carterae.1